MALTEVPGTEKVEETKFKQMVVEGFKKKKIYPQFANLIEFLGGWKKIQPRHFIVKLQKPRH